jgi:hypothetical protein
VFSHSVVGSVLAVDEILNEDRKVSDPGVEADRDDSGTVGGNTNEDAAAISRRVLPDLGPQNSRDQFCAATATD